MAIGMTVITAAPQSRREDGGVVVDEERLKFILPFSFLISNLCTTLLVSYLDCRLIPHLLSPIIAMCYCELYYSTRLTWPWLKYIILKSNMDRILHCCNASDWEKSRKKPTQDSNLYLNENHHGNAIWLHSKCKRNFLLRRAGLGVSKVTAQWLIFEPFHLPSITGSPPRHTVRTCSKL